MSLLERSYLALLPAAALPILLGFSFLLRSPSPTRQSKIPPPSERVLVLGATSGIGREIAHQYAERGARVCVVGRRQGLLDDVVRECGERCFGVCGDFSDVEDMIRVRDDLESGELRYFFFVWMVWSGLSPAVHNPNRYVAPDLSLFLYTS
jgi:hypothetical protein